MARVCQLTDELKYYLCMEPVDKAVSGTPRNRE